MKKAIITRTRVSFVVWIILGAAIWWMSPHFVCEIEPWDALSPFYSVSLFVVGIFAALVDPKRFWVSVFGIYIGQFLYAFLFLPGGPLCVLGMVFGAMYLLWSLFGGLIVYVFWRVIQRFRNRGIA